MKKQDPKVALLRTVPSLAGQPDKELAQMAPFVDEASVEAGFVLMREGTTGREAFLVVEGRADVSIAGRSVAQVGPGELLGEMALLDHSPRSATVTALTPMKLLVMDPAASPRSPASPPRGGAWPPIWPSGCAASRERLPMTHRTAPPGAADDPLHLGLRADST